MKVTFALWIESLGDGSCRVNFFKSLDDANAHAVHHDERFCDDIYEKTLEFDDNGQLIK